MGFLDFLKSGKAPERIVNHSELGELLWSEEDAAWLGSFRDLQFSLAYEKTATPSGELVAYALRLMRNRSWLESTLETEKAKWKKKYPAYVGEIDALQFQTLGFYRHRSSNQVFATLVSEYEDRCWRIEYKEDQCMGLGFDA